MSGQRVALVTGASGGIGRATALALAADGLTVACGFGTNEAGAKETVELIESAGVRAAAFGADVGEETQVDELFRQIIEWAGTPLVLVCNAGSNRDGLTVKFPTAEFERIVNTNLTGAFLCSRRALPGMLKARWGRIVHVSSAIALRGNAGQVAYAASKTGLLGLMRTLAIEYGSRGITTNAICPGFIETGMTATLPKKARDDLLRKIPADRFGSAEEIAAVIRFLASEEATYVNGAVIPVDGGMTA